MGHGEKVRVGLMLAVGVIVPGLANYALASVGHPAVGTAVWFTGYLTAMVAVWYVWIRPIDFRGAGG